MHQEEEDTPCKMTIEGSYTHVLQSVLDLNISLSIIKVSLFYNYIIIIIYKPT